jgi:hypothetical protein
MGGHRLNLGDVVGLDGIAEDDAHAYGFRRKVLELASRPAAALVGGRPMACRGRFSCFNTVIEQ